MQAQTTARVEKVCKTQTFPNSTFTKRDLILNLDPNGKYENVIAVTFVKDKTSLLDAVNKGDTVTVEYYIQGRSYLKDGRPEAERRYFNELRGFALSSGAVQDDDREEETEDNFDDVNDDLPF